MSKQSQTTANAPAPKDPVLCKMGCGFFGSGATENCCSKCWRSSMQKKEPEAAPAPPPEAAPIEEEPMLEEEEPQPMEIEPVVDEPETCLAPTQKKKKKKASYKSLMMGMTKCSPERDAEKDKESLRQVTGGGAFSKIEKI